jgi:hypothetical protein
VEYSLYVDQLALKRWHGKIDATDAFLVAFISRLNPHNQRVSACMRDGLFSLNRSWVIGELPLLQLTEDNLGRRLHELERLGLVDLKLFPDAGGHRRLYGKLSRLWFAELEKAKKLVEQPPQGENPHRGNSSIGAPAIGATAPGPTGEIPQYHDSLKNHEEETPPPLTAAGGASQKEEPQPDLFPEESPPFEDPLANDPLLATCRVCGSIYQRARTAGCNYCEEHRPAATVPKADDFPDSFPEAQP